MFRKTITLINETFLATLTFFVVSEVILIWFGVVLAWLGQFNGHTILVAFQFFYMFGTILASSSITSQVCKILYGLIILKSITKKYIMSSAFFII